MRNEIVLDGGGRIVRVVDRGGTAHAILTWRDDELTTLDVIGARVCGDVIDDRLLGRAHAVGETTMSAIDWRRPTQIPTIADPARLPPGAGGAILNTIALLARQPLRYAGPYPTPALFRTLARSFATTATESEFTADLATRASRIARDEIAIAFVPDPCDRVAIAPNVWIESRRGLARASIDGVTYEGATGMTRLADGVAAIWIGDAPYASIAGFAEDGTLIDGIHAIPICTSPVIGRAFPPPLRDALAELVGDAVPAPIAEAARAIVVARPITWRDLGARAARATSSGFEVHAAIWDRIAPHGLARVALAIAEALVPVVTSTVVASISNRVHFAP